MKITKITQQVKRTDRYSIFVEEKYAFSLSESALLEAGLASGQELSAQQVNEFKSVSADDKVYQRALRYAVMRPRSIWEMSFYLERKDASPALIESTLNKLIKINLLDDEAFAKTFVADQRLLRPASRRKIILELRKKRVSQEVIDKAVGNDSDAETAALQDMIERKRRQSKYHDDQKLMQYLARQGFNYSDIKAALETSN